MDQNLSDITCKICSSINLTYFLHTARCNHCGALMNFPYKQDNDSTNQEPDYETKYRANRREWCRLASRKNHINFTNMFLFAIESPEKIYNTPIKILDYGAGGGAFAAICKSFLPMCSVYAVDKNDCGLMDEYKTLTTQILWTEFFRDKTKFDYIFLNDVFEHVNNPDAVLAILSNKLDTNGKIFIDTPKQFWLYPLLKFFYKPLYIKLLKGTVDTDHVQIWSEKSFHYVVTKNGLRAEKYSELSEYTREADFYLKQMGINNGLIHFLGSLFYNHAKKLACNKIMALLVKQ